MSARIKDRVFRLLRFEPASDPRPAAAPDLAAGRITGEHVVRLRKLLAEFAVPNSASAVARAPRWKGMFQEPVKTVLQRLKTQGILVESNDPRARMCRGRDESDLRVLCLEFGLSPTGTSDQLVDRLLTIDPTGSLLGYAGELLQCSNTAAHLLSPTPQPKTDTTREVLTARAEKAARDGDLAACRDTYLWMANHLVRRNKKIQALQALCVVCVFDLCGARASLDADLVQRMRALSQEMDLSMKEVRETFLRVSRRLGLPKKHVGR